VNSGEYDDNECKDTVQFCVKIYTNDTFSPYKGCDNDHICTVRLIRIALSRTLSLGDEGVFGTKRQATVNANMEKSGRTETPEKTVDCCNERDYCNPAATSSSLLMTVLAVAVAAIAWL
ncbi:hypothetical protein PENTCL1PPCAC_3594, partial [Pristionchus entomophagus]